ncbi:MAG: NAD(P)H-dependent oxidoreductase subunit E [Myxococcales bacterium]|nr:NAD(P)H-dependent oxidoreductase subunit E [Myxococcales bacterium]
MPLAFSDSTLKQIADLRARYPDAQAACMPVLHLAQDEFGHLGDDAIHLVAETLDLPDAHVYGVVTFYTMFRREPSGKNVLRVCTNVSCMITGGYDVLARVCKRLGIQPGQKTADGLFSLVEEECLAACADAPATVCGQKYYLRLDTPAKVDAMLDELARVPEQERVAPFWKAG